MASETPNENYGRGMRQTRRSQRAREADLEVTGLQNSRVPGTSHGRPAPSKSPAVPTPPIAAFDSSAMADQFPSTGDTRNIDTAQLDSIRAAASSSMKPDLAPPYSALPAHQAVKSTEPTAHDVGSSKPPHAGASASGKIATSAQIKQNAAHPPIQGEGRSRKGADSLQPSAKPERVSKPQKSHKKKSSGRRAPAETQPKKKPAATPEDDLPRFMPVDPLLRPAKLQIHRWEHPVPQDFLHLSDELKAAKAYVDAQEGANDNDPELDDWHEFCGLESDLFPDLSLTSSVGLNFVTRAKRAYRAGKSWVDFELEELAIDSRAGARALKDPEEREIALSSSLSNTLRLYVFEQLKVRLCHEIWLQAYPERVNAASARVGAIGTVAPTPAPSDKTALQVAAERLASLPDRLQPMVPGTALPIRTEPELPSRDREVHQPQGPRVRATQANLRRMGVYGRNRLAGVHLDMQTSEEE